VSVHRGQVGDAKQKAQAASDLMQKLLPVITKVRRSLDRAQSVSDRWRSILDSERVRSVQVWRSGLRR
jgi:hypothetical protein